MTSSYDKYYQTEDLFGQPYPQLIEFLSNQEERGKVLDLGCGQGRDAIPLARMGFEVIGIDSSKVGIDQLNQIAINEGLQLIGRLEDIYDFQDYKDFDVILLDSMFHFGKNDKVKEIGLIQRIISHCKKGCLLVICIQDTGKKVNLLNQALDHDEKLLRLADTRFEYTFEDQNSGHRSKSEYRMIIVQL